MKASNPSRWLILYPSQTCYYDAGKADGQSITGASASFGSDFADLPENLRKSVTSLFKLAFILLWLIVPTVPDIHTGTHMHTPTEETSSRVD